MKRTFTLACALLVLFFLPSYAQTIQWNNAPQKGYVYQITNREAQKLLAVARKKSITEKLLHNLVDTFDVEKGWTERPDKGHFIMVSIVGNKIHCNYTSVFPYQVFLLKEYNALAIQVLDKDGNLRSDAKVKLGWHNRISIDTATKSYRIENRAFSDEYHIATVELDGFRSVFNIQKHEVPVWYNNYDYGEDNGPDFYSYLITDKNKYKPGDKVRFKSYALSNSRNPIKRELEIWLTAYPVNIKLGTISPHRPGSFAGEFMLHDSLKLQLDKTYQLRLQKNWRVVSSCNFRYEDYELSGNKLDVQLESASQYNPDTNTVVITATDENGLMLKDAHAEVVVETNTILETFQPVAILPDTLMRVMTDLDPENPTVISIPPGLFQKTNTMYAVKVSVRNSENQLMETKAGAAFFYSVYNLVSRFSGDSICFDLLKNNMPMKNIPVAKRTDDEVDWHQVTFPYREKINPTIREYHFENEFIRRNISMVQLAPQLSVQGGIQQDSFKISLVNPHKLDVTWMIYQGGQLIHRSTGVDMKFGSRINDRTQNYYAELLYVFGGQEQIKQRVFEFREDFLDVSLDIPDRVFPGQKVDATITVKDQRGMPAKGVDLTAVAVTAKLGYSLPSLPYYGTTSSARSQALHYSKSNNNHCQAELRLDYAKWNKLSRLDTMKYYQFTYPSGKGFLYTLNISDSTQFAPFVMKDGVAQQIYVVEVDHLPVYFSWTSQPAAYSFYVNPHRKHVVTLRLWDRVIMLDTMQFEQGKKTILSVDLDNLPGGSETTMLEKKFSSTELHRIRPLVSSFARPSGLFSYLDNDLKNDFVPLFGIADSRGHANLLVGPLPEGRKTYVESNGLKTTYRHAGGFHYAFEDNIVYKADAWHLWPVQLSNQGYNPMLRINDLQMTKKVFLSKQYIDKKKARWQAQTIDMADADGRVRIFLPEVNSASIAAVLFRNPKTNAVIAPYFDKASRYLPGLNTLPVGRQTIIVLYTDGRFLKMDSIVMNPHHHLVVDLNHAPWQPAGLESEEWLAKYEWEPDRYSHELTPMTTKPAQVYQFTTTATGNLTGSVYDENNDPLPGAVVQIKGTQHGAVTDINGHFVLQLDDYSATIMVSFIGYVQEEFLVTRGSEIRVALQPDIQALEEIVVIGYGVSARGMSSALQGRVAGLEITSRAAEEPEPSVPDDAIDNEENPEAENELYQELLALKTIRSNFSDVGFWEPKLYTDNHGISRFSIMFPDDITRWDAVVYAMNRRLQTGTFRKSIKSYKPLMAELKVPGFLTAGDSANFTGKVLNYTSEPLIKGKSAFTGGIDFTRDIEFRHFHTDVLPVVAATTDSLKLMYTFTRDDGYMDGEERTVPVVEEGIVRADGSLSVPGNGETVNIKASQHEKRYVEIMDSQLEIYKGAVGDLVNYRFLCNEQLASRLIGLINHKRIMEYEGKPFRHELEIKRIIAKLLRNQNKEFLWSWWEVSNKTSWWMSAHILRALKCASDAGYDVNLNIENLSRKITYKFDFLKQYHVSDIDLLQSLAEWNAALNYGKYIPALDSVLRIHEGRDNQNYSCLTERFLLQEIRQMRNLHYDRNYLLKYKQEGMLGDLYFSDGKMSRFWWANEISANMVAYRMIKRDSLLYQYLVPMQLHFMTTHGNNGWNTYQSSNLIMCVLPDLLAEGATKAKTATISVSGKVNETVSQFPYRMELMPGEELSLRKESGMPVYLMQYRKERVTEAKTGVEGFSIKTWFSGNSNMLTAGKPVDLIVDVEVKKKSVAEHVMIEVPIPGACSYADKRPADMWVESHREYYKEKTVIFCEQMEPGRYTFKISLLPRFTGRYSVNPAQVSLMYFPVVNANTELKKVVVE